MKKLSKIDESTWGNLLDKGAGEKEAKEDTFNFNFYQIKPVDLGPEFPFLWADTDLIANDEIYFDWDTLQRMLPQIKKTGWRLPYSPNQMRDVIKLINTSPNLKTVWHRRAFGMIENTDTGEYVSFPTGSQFGETYWCEDDYHSTNPGRQIENERVFEIGENYYQDGKKMVLLSTNNMEKTRTARIRLVKDK